MSLLRTALALSLLLGKGIQAWIALPYSSYVSKETHKHPPAKGHLRQRHDKHNSSSPWANGKQFELVLPKVSSEAESKVSSDSKDASLVPKKRLQPFYPLRTKNGVAPDSDHTSLVQAAKKRIHAKKLKHAVDAGEDSGSMDAQVPQVGKKWAPSIFDLLDDSAPTAVTLSKDAQEVLAASKAATQRKSNHRKRAEEEDEEEDEEEEVSEASKEARHRKSNHGKQKKTRRWKSNHRKRAEEEDEEGDEEEDLESSQEATHRRSNHRKKEKAAAAPVHVHVHEKRAEEEDEEEEEEGEVLEASKEATHRKSNHRKQAEQVFAGKATHQKSNHPKQAKAVPAVSKETTQQKSKQKDDKVFLAPLIRNKLGQDLTNLDVRGEEFNKIREELRLSKKKEVEVKVLSKHLSEGLVIASKNAESKQMEDSGKGDQEGEDLLKAQTEQLKSMAEQTGSKIWESKKLAHKAASLAAEQAEALRVAAHIAEKDAEEKIEVAKKAAAEAEKLYSISQKQLLKVDEETTEVNESAPSKLEKVDSGTNRSSEKQSGRKSQKTVFDIRWGSISDANALAAVKDGNSSTASDGNSSAAMPDGNTASDGNSSAAMPDGNSSTASDGNSSAAMPDGNSSAAMPPRSKYGQEHKLADIHDLMNKQAEERAQEALVVSIAEAQKKAEAKQEAERRAPEKEESAVANAEAVFQTLRQSDEIATLPQSAAVDDGSLAWRE